MGVLLSLAGARLGLSICFHPSTMTWVPRLRYRSMKLARSRATSGGFWMSVTIEVAP